ncbi:MAG: hypothetical protein R3C10_04440 [Pirellulales bacterium]
MKAQPTTKTIRQHRRAGGQRGVALMFVLIAVVVVTALGAALVRAMLIEIRQSRIDEWAVQADWLVTSGAQRAAAQLAADPDYRGETWQIAAAELDGRHAAVVEIAVHRSADVSDGSDATRNVAVTARYPHDATVFATCRKAFNVSTQSIASQSREDVP